MVKKIHSILVIGGTGRQGFAVAKRVVDAGFECHVMTRNPAGEAAEKLVQLGASVTEGDMDDEQSLDRAMKNVDAVFSVQDFWEAGYEREVAQGKRVVDVSVRSGIKHFVYSSVGGAERTEGLGITHFDSKRVIEAHLKQSGLSYTIFRPVTFFENFVSSNVIASQLDQGFFQFPIEGDKPFQMVALDDLGFAVVQTLKDPERFSGLELELASQTLTFNEFTAALSIGFGSEIVFSELPYVAFERSMNAITTLEAAALHKAGPSFLAQHKWHTESTNSTGGWAADLNLIDQLGLQRTDATTWVSSIDWNA